MAATIHRIESKLTGRLQLVLDDTSYGANDEGKRVIDLGAIEIPFTLDVSGDLSASYAWLAEHDREVAEKRREPDDAAPGGA